MQHPWHEMLWSEEEDRFLLDQGKRHGKWHGHTVVSWHSIAEAFLRRFGRSPGKTLKTVSKRAQRLNSWRNGVRARELWPSLYDEAPTWQPHWCDDET